MRPVPLIDGDCAGICARPGIYIICGCETCGPYATRLLGKLPLQVCYLPLHLCIARPFAHTLEVVLDFAFEMQSLATGASLEGVLDDIATKLGLRSVLEKDFAETAKDDSFVVLLNKKALTFCCRHSLQALLTGCFLLSSWRPSSDPSASGDSIVPGELSNPASEAFLFRFDIPLVECLSLTGLPKLLPPPPTPPPLPTPAGSATLAGATCQIEV
jgi:hypothetical protein